MPDTLIYHAQTLVAGILALTGGACVLIPAILQEKNRRESQANALRERKIRFGAVVFSDLEYFIDALRTLEHQLGEFSDRIGHDRRVFDIIDNLSIPNPTEYLYEDWKSQIGFEASIIAAVWQFRIDLILFNKELDSFMGARRRNAMEVPLLREALAQVEFSLWQEKISSLQAATHLAIESAEVVQRVLSVELPGDLLIAIRKGNVSETLFSKSHEADGKTRKKR